MTVSNSSFTMSNDTGTILSNTATPTTLDPVYIDGIFLMNFEESLTKEIAKDYTGVTNSGGVTLGAGFAIFPGTPDYLTLQNNSNLTANFAGITDITICSKFRTTHTFAQKLIDIGGGQGRMALGITSAGAVEIFADVSAQQTIQAASPLTTYNDGNWHYAMIVLGSGGNQMYVDGSQITPTYSQGDSGATTTIMTNSDQVTLGAFVIGNIFGGLDFVGDMEVAFISSHAYTSGEISALNSFTGTDKIPAFNTLSVSGHLRVNDQLIYQDGNQALYSTLQSDTDGVANWVGVKGILMENTAAQSLPAAGTRYTLLTPTTVFDSGSISYSSGVFTLGDSGLYAVYVSLDYATNQFGRRYLEILDSDGIYHGETQTESISGGQETPLSTSAIVYWDGTGTYTLTVKATQTSGGSMSTGPSASRPTRIGIVKFI
jgi:hypothetical protein